MSNVVVLVDSTFIRAEVKVETFIVKTSFGDLKFDHSDVSYIEYQSTANGGKDELFASDGSSYYGAVLPEIITMEIDSQEIEIPKSDIKYIVLFTGRSGNISDETKEKLRAFDI